jgi:hypothetical protein
MATPAPAAPAPLVAAEPAQAGAPPRSSGFELIVPLGAIYVVLLVIAPFLAMAFRH